jgi:GNAT superfamily N-acetyltransferase
MSAIIGSGDKQSEAEGTGRTVDRMSRHLSNTSIRQAMATDIEKVTSILSEAAQWLERNGMAMWRGDELTPLRIAADVEAGLFFIAEDNGEAAGVVKFQLVDPDFWPDVKQGQSAFVHRLAVKRRFAGGKVSSGLLSWAVARTRSLGKRYLRLDCEASRTNLRAVYEKFGFIHHSDRQVILCFTL